MPIHLLIKTPVVAFSLLLSVLTIQGMPVDTLKTRHKYKMLNLYSYGTSNRGETSPCGDFVAEHYGFKVIRKGDCSIGEWNPRRWDRHNARVERKLKRRHGKDWRERYKAHLAACN